METSGLMDHIIKQWVLKHKHSAHKQRKLEHKPRCVYLDIDKREKEDYDARMLLKGDEVRMGILNGGDLNIIAIDQKGKNLLNRRNKIKNNNIRTKDNPLIIHKCPYCRVLVKDVFIRITCDNSEHYHCNTVLNKEKNEWE